MYKIIGADGKEYGPVSAEVLRQWVAEGRANGQTKVLVEGTTDWKKLQELTEFGEPTPAAPRQGAPSPITGPPSGLRNNSLAVTGLVLGILSLTLGLCCYGLPFNMAGIVCSVVALAQIRNDPEHERGQGVAIAGLVLSILSILLASSVLFFSLAFHSPGWMRHIRRL